MGIKKSLEGFIRESIIEKQKEDIIIEKKISKINKNRRVDVYIKDGFLKKYRYPGMLIAFNGEKRKYELGDRIDKKDIESLIAREEYVIVEEEGKLYEYNEI